MPAAETARLLASLQLQDKFSKTADAVEAMHRDPEMVRFDTSADIGGCWVASQRFAWYLHRGGVPFAWLKFTNPPHLRTPAQHAILVDGTVYDWTFRQIVPGASWPHVEALSDYAVRFGPQQSCCETCGSGRPGAGHHCPGIHRDQLTYLRAIQGGTAIADIPIASRARGATLRAQASGQGGGTR